MNISLLEYIIPPVGLLFGWFVVSLGDQPIGLPIWCCYTLLLIAVSRPLAQWLSGQIDAFDPLGLLAVFSVHFFGVTPMYQYASASYPYLQWDVVTDGWVVYWFAINTAVVSIVFFVLGNKFCNLAVPARGVEYSIGNFSAQRGTFDLGSAYRVRTFTVWLFVFAVLLKGLILAKFGGIGGMMSAYQDRLEQGVTQYNPLAGLGALVYLSDAAPVLAAIAVVITYSLISPVRGSAWGWWMLVVGIPVSFVYVGLIGSRSNTVYTAFILLCYSSIFWRKLRAINLVIGGLVMVIFMNSYLTYKFGGISAVFDEGTKKAAFAARQLENPLEFLLVRDFGRMDVQVIAMREMFDEGYSPVWGRSYVGGVFSIVPSTFFPGRPENFTLEKTEIIFPRLTLNGEKATTLVFGGAGEAWVNWKWFAPLCAIPYYYLVALCIFRFRSGINGMWDKFMCPIYSLVPIALLIYDSNSLLYFLAQFALFPFLVSRRLRSALIFGYRGN